MVDFGKHSQGTHSSKIGADSSAENTPNTPECICQIVCPSPKVWDIDEKRLHWASVVRGEILLCRADATKGRAQKPELLNSINSIAPLPFH